MKLFHAKDITSVEWMLMAWCCSNTVLAATGCSVAGDEDHTLLINIYNWVNDS